MQKNKTPILVTLAIYNSSTEAYLAKSRLEAQGIRCFLENESVNMLYANALGGVVLKVSNTDFDEAYTLLQELRKNKKQNSESALKELNAMFVCPSCGQLNEDNKSITQKQPFLTKLLINLGIRNHKIVCDYCLATFSKDELVRK
ncbi:MAG: DUF2007 domain-containing protein [Bacteroidetes bacterium]|nr:DUF2007 domain-containing protein [Bacteroidota bacterium]